MLKPNAAPPVDRSRLRMRLVRMTRAGLAFGGWLAGVAQLDPALPYPSHAGARFTYEFPQLMPVSWIDRFPESEAPLIYSGAPVLDPYYSQRVPLRFRFTSGGYQPIGLAVRTRSTTTLIMWSVTFGPAPGSPMGGAA